MNGALQALVWKNWQLTWRSLALQQLGVIVFTWAVLSILWFGDSETVRNIGAHVVVLLSLVFLLASASAIPKKEGTSGYVTGFPFRTEYVLPAPTSTLFFVPLTYLTLLFLFAYAFPLFLLSIAFGIDGPQFFVAFFIIETTLLTICLSWWSTNNFANIVGWITVMVLYWFGILYPGISIINEPAEDIMEIFVNSPMEYILPAIVTAIFIFLTFLGVRKQRHGENLLGLENSLRMLGLEQSFQLFQSGNAFPCPTSSPVKAEIWKERQLRGVATTILLGASMGVLALILLRLIRSYAGNAEEIETTAIYGLALGFYAMLFMIIHFKSFGITHRNGVAWISAFNKTVGLGTGKLVLIKLSASYISSILAGIAMAATIWMTGSLFIDNFADLRVNALEEFSTYLALPATNLILDTGSFLIFFFNTAVLWSIFAAWFTLKPREMGFLTSGALIYIFVWVLIVAKITDGNEFDALNQTVWIKHLWLFIIGMPLATVYFYRAALSDLVLNNYQLLVMGLICMALWGIRTWRQFEHGFYAQDYALEVMITDSLVGFLPLLVVGGALWTMGRIRHS